MRLSTVLVAVIVGGSAVAVAQPGPAPAPSEPEAPPPEPTPPAPPPPAPTPPPAPAPPPLVIHHDTDDQALVTPVGWAFGIGIGYALPTSLETPNTASLRLRSPGGLTFEPRVALANASNTTKTEAPGTTMSTTDSTSELLLETSLRKALIEHGRYQFEVIGGARIDIAKDDPDGDNNSRTTTDLSLFWGIGVGAWITPHWQFSFNIENPLISYTSTNQENGVGMSTTNSTTNIGAVFNPNVVMMIHLYN